MTNFQMKMTNNTFLITVFTAQFSSRWYLCARKSPYAPHPVSQRFPNIVFEMVPMSIWLTMALSRPFQEDCLALSL